MATKIVLVWCFIIHCMDNKPVTHTNKWWFQNTEKNLCRQETFDVSHASLWSKGCLCFNFCSGTYVGWQNHGCYFSGVFWSGEGVRVLDVVLKRRVKTCGSSFNNEFTGEVMPSTTFQNMSHPSALTSPWLFPNSTCTPSEDPNPVDARMNCQPPDQHNPD